MLKDTQLYQKILEGDAIPKLSICLEGAGPVSMVIIEDSAFPQHSWLLKPNKKDTRNPQQKYINKKLCSARLVSEIAYGILKGRWRILYKQTECRIYNLKYVIMSSMVLHNLCISVNDLCETRWRQRIRFDKKRLYSN